jgi:drug/metabolite transporter (DMT)-like permease
MFYLVVLALLWGPSFVFIKIASTEMPIISLVTWRLSLAAIMLFAALKIMKIKLPNSPKLWLHAGIQGFFSSAMPFMLFGYSMLHVKSIIGGCINGTVPMITAIFAHFCIEQEKLSLNKVFGIILGMLGFLSLLLPTILDGSIDSDTFSILACLGGSLCYAIGMIYARKFLYSLPPYTGPCMQLSTAIIYMLPLMLIFDTPINIMDLSSKVIMSVVALSIFGTTLAFIVYFKIVEKYGATYLSMVAYLLPIASAIFGFLMLGEVPSKYFVLAIALIMTGLVFVNKKKEVSN